MLFHFLIRNGQFFLVKSIQQKKIWEQTSEHLTSTATILCLIQAQWWRCFALFSLWCSVWVSAL